MPDLKFPFSLEKLIHAIAYFASRGIHDLSKLKAAKLLYFADKDHLLRFGRPIVGDVYFCLPYGPVPSLSLNEMNDAIDADGLEEGDAIRADAICFASALNVLKPRGGHPVFRARNGFDANVFSKSEVASLERVVSQFGAKAASELVEISHKEVAWTIPNEGRSQNGRAPIPYELFFHGAGEDAQEMLAFIKEEQKEQRDLECFMEDISGSEALQENANSGVGRAVLQGEL